MWGATLSIVIPVVLIAYGVWLAVRLIFNRKKGPHCGGGCAGCPYAGGCDRCRDASPARKSDPIKPESAKEKPHD